MARIFTVKGHLNKHQIQYQERLRNWYKCIQCNGGESTCNCKKWKDVRSWDDIYVGRFFYNFVIDTKSSETIIVDITHLSAFAWYEKLQNAQDLATYYQTTGDKDKDLENLEERIKDFIRYLRENKQTSPSNQKGHIFGIAKAYKRNRVMLNQDNLLAVVGEDEDADLPYGYNTKQIELLVFHSKLLVYKALFLFLASTGCRRGVIWETAINRKTGLHNFLRIKDLRHATEGYDTIPWGNGPQMVLDVIKRDYPNIIQNSTYQVTCYRGSRRSQYTTFCSPEAYLMINRMLEERKNAGEDFLNIDRETWEERLKRLQTESLTSWMIRNGESPVFRTHFNTKKYRGAFEQRRREKIKKAIDKPLTKGSIRAYMYDLRNEIGDKVKFTPEGHIIHPYHGFRHFHKVTMEDTPGIKPNISTWLQGRKIDKIEEGYLRGGRLNHKALIEYFKAVNSLTIYKDDILTLENIQLKGEMHNIESRQAVRDAAVISIRQDMDRMKKDFQHETSDNKAVVQFLLERLAKYSPHEADQARKMLAEDSSIISSLPLENRKGQIIEVAKLEDNEEGEGNPP